MAMIKPEPVDSSIDDMIDTGDPEDRKMADELQSTMTGDDKEYSSERFLYNFPFFKDPNFLWFLKSEVESYLHLHQPDFTWDIEHAKDFDDFVSTTWEVSKYKDMLAKQAKHAQWEYGSKFAAQVDHMLDQEDKSGMLDEALEKIYREEVFKLWKDWRHYYTKGHFPSSK